jgi:hypothetical protein
MENVIWKFFCKTRFLATFYVNYRAETATKIPDPENLLESASLGSVVCNNA